MSTISNQARQQDTTPCASASKNVGDWERLASLGGGCALALLGLEARSTKGLLMLALGGGLIYRGLTGHCHLYDLLGVHTNAPENPHASIASGQGVHVVHSVTIQQPAKKLYEYWRDLKNLPSFMRHVDGVEILGPTTSKWRVETSLGPVEWIADIIADVPGQTISWRSRDNSTVACAGSIHFKELPELRATQVDLNLRYDAPGARAESVIASLFGQSPQQFIREDLRRFKQLMETGEIPTTKGQPVGRCGSSA